MPKCITQKCIGINRKLPPLQRLRCPPNRFLYSAAGGTVAYSGPDTNNQYSMVIIKHEEGRLSAYSPLSKVTVKEGDTVVQGEKLGVLAASVGHEGLLHFEVRQHGNPVDPMTLISE
ncbi:MAG: M23 family metallopeptidase [Gammaproteobacteria bacterium]|nr:M23 family metallopeptidase [Gammaproteobacteria bacterium]